MKKKLMIGLLVAAGVMILYHALFYRVKMNKSYVNQLENTENIYYLPPMSSTGQKRCHGFFRMTEFLVYLMPLADHLCLEDMAKREKI